MVDNNVLYVMSQAERVKVIYDHLNIILMTIVFLSLLVLVVSALGMASATGISILLGLLLAWPMSKVVAVFFGKLVSRIPARRAIQVPTRDALAYE